MGVQRCSGTGTGYLDCQCPGLTNDDAAGFRDADLADGTVFFLYSPFEGPVLSHVLGRLHAVATERPIVVCALGIDLERNADWLSPRPSNAFWLTIYDSVVPGIPPRSPRGRSSLEGFSDAIVFERV